MDRIIGLISIIFLGTMMIPQEVGTAEYVPPVVETVLEEEGPAEEVEEIEEAPEVTCHEKVMEYIEEDNAPFLVDTTAYCHGTVCSHGDKAREGIVAAAPEWWGMACVIYEAIPTEDGYECGDLIGVYEILDTGYGKSSGDGVPSKIRSDKGSRGTIEIGQCIDRYCYTYSGAKEWMRKTGGKIFIQIVEGEG